VTERALLGLVLEQGGGHTMIVPSVVIFSHMLTDGMCHSHVYKPGADASVWERRGRRGVNR
jgi:hypothetical protein